MPDWPSLILAFVLTAYWGRVLRLAYKIRRRTGRSAAFAPAEPLGRLLRILWYPAVAVWIAHAWISAWGYQAHPILRPLWHSGAAAWAAALTAVAALAMTLVCWKRMGRSWRMGINPDEKTELIVSGPYACVRHPIYALSTLLMLCSIAIVCSPLMLAAGAIHLTLLQWEARREERHLLQHHGQAYGEYCRRVGRFIPRLPRAYGR
jgi:protein-S-isoprenylcysteine O-methyltransferase Ste14